jgi:ABC-type uncharacterized transport system involved in gliding motility auxiliary subunit
MRAGKRRIDPGRDEFAEKHKKLAMAALIMVLMVFLAGVTSVLVLQAWPDLFEKALFSSHG